MWGFLASNFKHKLKGKQHQYIFFEKRYGSCKDFAHTLNSLLIRQGIESYCFAGLKHTFNMVNIDGKFYPVDSDASSAHELKNFFGKKNYFMFPDLCDLFDYIDVDIEELNKNYFEDEEIFAILDKVLPSYNEKRYVLEENSDQRE